MVNTLWEKIESQHELSYSDLEQYLYTKDYISTFYYQKEEDCYVYLFKTFNFNNEIT